MRNIILLLSFISVFMACKPSVDAQYVEEVQNIDRMLEEVDSLRSSFEAVDLAKVRSELPQIDSLSAILTSNGVDQNDKVYWTKTLASLFYVKEPYEKFSRDASKIDEGLALSRTQLQTLRNSIVDEQLDSSEIAEYYFTETKAFNDVVLLHRKRVGPAQEALAIWDTAVDRYLLLAAKSDSLAK